MIYDPNMLVGLLSAIPSAWDRSLLLSILLARETANALENGGIATAHMAWLSGKLDESLSEYWQGITNHE